MPGRSSADGIPAASDAGWCPRAFPYATPSTANPCGYGPPGFLSYLTRSTSLLLAVRRLGSLIVLWDGASYHRAGAVREMAAALRIELMPLPGYSPDLMPVEALWRRLREDVTYHHGHASLNDPTRRVAAFQDRINQKPCALADRLWVKDHLDPEGKTQVLRLDVV